MRTAYELLRILTKGIEPSKGCSHSLTLADGGKTLVLSISANGGFYKFNLDDDDFDEDPFTLSEVVLDLFRQAVRDESTKPRG